MKLHALALCLAGTLSTAIAANADHTSMHHNMSSDGSRATYVESYSSSSHDTPYRYTTSSGWVREVIYPDLPPIQEVASKVQDLIRMNEQEVAELRAMGGRARTAGWENIASVYDLMIQDHMRGIDQSSAWLARNDFDVPGMPSAVTAADVSPETSVDKQIAMHQQMFDESLDRLHGERSSTVRGMLLMNAATSARHLSLLNSLDQDVTRGRKDLSARLQWEMNPSYMASNRAELMARLDEEWRTTFRTQDTTVAENTTPEQVIIIQQVPAPAPVVAEVPAPAPAPAPVVTERVVERRVYVNQPARVAGRRQIRRGARRPAF